MNGNAEHQEGFDQPQGRGCMHATNKCPTRPQRPCLLSYGMNYGIEEGRSGTLTQQSSLPGQLTWWNALTRWCRLGWSVAWKERCSRGIFQVTDQRETAHVTMITTPLGVMARDCWRDCEGVRLQQTFPTGSHGGNVETPV